MPDQEKIAAAVRRIMRSASGATTKSYIEQMSAHESQPARQPATRPQPDALFEAVAAVTQRTPPNDDWTLLSDIEFAVLTKVANELRKVQATPDQVNAFPAWYAPRKDIRPIEPCTLPRLWVSFLAAQGHTSVTITI